MQSEQVRQALLATGCVDEIEVQTITTRGDKILDVPLAKVGGKGLFVKEIEEALLDETIDFAVHSLKDMPVRLPDGLVFGATPEREDPGDLLVCREVSSLEDLPDAPVIGTSSLRRAAQIQRLVPGARVVSLRGNVDTRLEKLRTQVAPPLDAIILAAAGLNRLGKGALERAVHLDPHVFVPAVGQGALAIECRLGDREVLDCLGRIHHETTAVRISAERAFLEGVEGSCQIPVAAFALCNDGSVTLDALILSVDGAQVVRGQRTGPIEDASALGAELAASLLNQGGAEILRVCLELSDAL